MCGKRHTPRGRLVVDGGGGPNTPKVGVMATSCQELGKGRLVSLEGDPVPMLPHVPAAEDEVGRGGGGHVTGCGGGSILMEPAHIRIIEEASADRRPEVGGQGALEDDVRRRLLRQYKPICRMPQSNFVIKPGNNIYLICHMY